MADSVENKTISQQIEQLNEARKIALENPAYYPKIVQGILPIAGSPSLDLRRWSADFLAESLATPFLSTADKESLAVAVLGTLKDRVESQNEDALVLKSSVITAASVYPLVLRWTINNAQSTDKNVEEAWRQMAAIKSRILHIWDSAVTPVKICCIKFAQRVVLAQTVSNGMENKQNGLDLSLSMIPANHALLDHSQLEAEAAGLLDRMLGVLQDNSSDALLVDATLNTLSILVRTRPSTSNKILNAVLNFNPFKLANSPMTPKTKVLIKSMEKTTRLLLFHLAKRDPNNPMAGRLHQQVERLVRSRAEILEESSRKRPLPQQAPGNFGDAKRQRVEPGIVGIPKMEIPPLGPGPHSLASVFTLTNNRDLAAFNAEQVPAPLAARISLAALASIDHKILDWAINGVRNRLNKLHESAQPAPPINAETAPLGVEEDDDDYEPDFYVAEDNEQIINKLDSAPPEAIPALADDASSALASLGPFKLPGPPKITPASAARLGELMASRVFEPLTTMEDPVAKKTIAGINRLAATANDRDSWVTLLARLAARSSSGLEDGGSNVKSEDISSALERPYTSVGDSIREKKFNYILEDFRRRIDIAVSWLNEEWENDKVTKEYNNPDAPLHYEKWALRLIDGFFDYLTPQDKILTRFLSELPDLNKEMFLRVKALCSDPTRVTLTLTSLLYVVMMKPPFKEMALDTVAEIWQEVEAARPLAAKYLTKFRPGFIESQTAAGDESKLAAP